MRKKFRLRFILAVLLLILSEYFFLQEAYGAERWRILFLTATGIVAGILLIISVIRKYNS